MAVKGKKRGRASSNGTPAQTKRSRRNGAHPADLTPPATIKQWQPPAGSWEDDVDSIDAAEEEESGKLMVYLEWKNGQKTKHPTQVIYKKCPQKVSRVEGEGMGKIARLVLFANYSTDVALLRETC